MSKNYELLQQAEIGLGTVTAFPAGRDASAPESLPRETTEAALSGVEPSVREESMKLVHRLFLTPGLAAPKAVVFAAIDSKNGCGWLSAVVAQLLAKSVPRSVCLVEGNFRTPSLPKLFGTKKRQGFSDALQQEGAIRGFATQVGSENLWLLSAGSAGPESTVLLNGDRMKGRVKELRSEFDYILIDAPPMNAFADGAALGRLADGVVLVLEANVTRREAALRVTENLRNENIPVLGAVLNSRTFPIPSALYKRL